MNEFPISHIIAEARRRKKWGIDRLARAAGCHPNSLRRLEQGDGLPSRELSDALADVLGLSQDELWQQVENIRSEMGRKRGNTATPACLEHNPLLEAVNATSPFGQALDALLEGIPVDSTTRQKIIEAFPYLMVAMRDPVVRQITDTALRGWAALSSQQEGRL